MPRVGVRGTPMKNGGGLGEAMPQPRAWGRDHGRGRSSAGCRAQSIRGGPCWYLRTDGTGKRVTSHRSR